MKRVIISVLAVLMGAMAGAIVVGRTARELINKEREMSDKHLTLFLMMNQWVKIKQKGINLAEYFDRNNYRKIAVYGMSYAGKSLVDELKGTDIDVAYGIDKNADAIDSDVDIISMDGVLEPVDAVIVTAATWFDEIEKNLSKKINCPIISLEEVLFDV